MPRFIKYHGLGNDFVVFEGGLDGRPSFTTAEVARICHRNTGVGADGLVLARPSAVAALKMELINSDGSVPEMCGNGLLCFVKYAVEELGARDNPLAIETGAGVLDCAWTTVPASCERPLVATVRVAMGPPVFDRHGAGMTGAGSSERLEVVCEGRRFDATGVGTGNPHLVIFGDASETTARTWGPPLAHHAWWPNGVNVEFARVLAPGHIEVTVWERGCGLTQACGTGATATAAAAVSRGLSAPDAPVRVTLPGGDLTITVAADYSQAWMEGPAAEVFRGTLTLPT